MTLVTDTHPLVLSLPGLSPEAAISLPPDWREALLDYLRIWGEKDEFLNVVGALQQAPGSALHLLDLQARGLADAGRYDEALSVIEKRLRRSPSIAASAFEASMLQAAGFTQHALNAASQLIGSYPRNVPALSAAAAILAEHDQYVEARRVLEELTQRYPGDKELLLTLAQLTLNAGDRADARQFLQRIGAGVPADSSNEQLLRLAKLNSELGSHESARAIEIELQRRRIVALAELEQLLEPLAARPADSSAYADFASSLLSGPDSISVSSAERRSIALQAIKHFGFTDLREGQIETVASVLRGESILVVMPTGAGKSLCYQLPALVMDGTSLVISPLIALMKDQVDNLPAAERRRATFINSTLSDRELEQRVQDIAAGKYKLVYAAPERLRHRSFLRTVRDAGVSLFVIDEAHCVSLWGHDFRPDYLFLKSARRELGYPPALAMTATAPPGVRDEILDYLSDDAGDDATVNPTELRSEKSRRPAVLSLDVFRSNLHLSAIQFNNEDEKLTAAVALAATSEGSGIIYVNSRRKSETLAYELRQAGVGAEAYHAGIDNRDVVQDRFMSGETRVIVATIAFGMGIDKPDIRFIVHFHPPRTLASYYQEVGRAGRDGQQSQGVLFYSNNDWSNLRRWTVADEYSVEFLGRVYAAVASQLGIAVGDSSLSNVEESHTSQVTGETVGRISLRRIQQVLDITETVARVSISILERAGLLEREFDIPERAELVLPSAQPAGAHANASLQKLLKGLDMKWGAAAAFKLDSIAKFMKWPLEEAELNLLELQSAGMLKCRFERRSMLVRLPQTPVDSRERLQRLLGQSTAVGQSRIDDVIGYATTADCRHGYISAHLGSRPITSCDVCDNCTGIRPELPALALAPEVHIDDDDMAAMIIDSLVSLPKPVGRHGLARVLTGALHAPASPEDARHFGRLRSTGIDGVIRAIDDLIQSSLLRQYDRNGYPLLAVTLAGREKAQVWIEEHPNLAEPVHDLNHAYVEEAPVPETVEKLKYTKLQTAIWAWRRRLSAQQSRPSYTIMDNDAILAIAEARPKNLDELSAIPGIGAGRLEHYGAALIDLIRLHPPEAGDEEILAMHRAAREQDPFDSFTNAVGNSDALTKHQTTAAVSPQEERVIYLKLQELRQRIAVQENCSPSMVASGALLKQIASLAPTDESALAGVRGFRSSGFAPQAGQICELIRQTVNSQRPDDG